MRYFFDLRDADRFFHDDIGTDCADLSAAKLEAAEALATYAKDVIPGSERREMAVEVRTGDGPVLKTKLLFEIELVNG